MVVKGQLYLWFKVSMNHTYVVHVAHSRHQPPHDPACLCLTEVLLPPDPLQELATTQQLQNQICVQLHTDASVCQKR